MLTNADSEAQAAAALVLAELHRLARHYMGGERQNHTLQATALVNEAYIRLTEQQVVFENRRQFVGIAARLMRQVLVDHARTKQASKRGEGQRLLTLTKWTPDPNQDEATTVDIISLNEALERLGRVDRRLAEVVELRYFGGLSLVETADTLQVSEATVSNDWKMARTWLRRELSNR